MKTVIGELSVLGGVGLVYQTEEQKLEAAKVGSGGEPVYIGSDTNDEVAQKVVELDKVVFDLCGERDAYRDTVHSLGTHLEEVKEDNAELTARNKNLESTYRYNQDTIGELSDKLDAAEKEIAAMRHAYYNSDVVHQRIDNHSRVFSVIALCLVVFLAIAFVQWDIDPAAWNKPARGTMGGFVVGVSFVLWLRRNF